MAKIKSQAGFSSGWLFILPTFLLLIGIIAVPLILNVAYSFTDKHLLHEHASFVGLRNYINILKSPETIHALIVSLIYTFVSLALQVFIGLVGALALDSQIRFKSFFRMFIILAYAIAPVVAVYSWKWVLSPHCGIGVYLMMKVGGFKEPVDLLGNPSTALLTLIQIQVWRGVPLMLFTFYAGLQAVPRQELEAAKLDGANYFQEVKYVILPHLRYLIGMMATLRTIWIFRHFEIPFLATGGGPANRTTTIPILIYKTVWLVYDVAQGAALSLFLMIVLAGVFVFYFKFLISKAE